MKQKTINLFKEGVQLDLECKEKVAGITNVVKEISKSSELSLKLLKDGNTFEGLLWGKVLGAPIGIYRRAPSMSHLLDSLNLKVKKECPKILIGQRQYLKPQTRFGAPTQVVSAAIG